MNGYPVYVLNNYSNVSTINPFPVSISSGTNSIGAVSIIQDGTGSRTLSWSNTWKFQGNVAPTLSTSANAVDLLVYYVRTTSNISVQLINNIG